MSKIVSVTMGPIRAKDLRLTSLVSEDHRKVDADNPITKAMMSQLPRLSLEDLITVRTFLQRRDSKAAGSMSTQEDVDSWIYMVEEEIRFRQKTAGGLLASLLSAIQPEVKS